MGSMYDERYYEERKHDLDEDFKRTKDESFEEIIAAVMRWQTKANNIQRKFQEITTKEAEAKKAEEESKKQKDVSKDKKVA